MSAATWKRWPRISAPWSPKANPSPPPPTPRLPRNDRDGNCSTITMRATRLQHFRKLNGNSTLDKLYWAWSLVVGRNTAVVEHHSRLLCVASILAAMLFGAGPLTAATPDSYDPWPGL